MACSYFKEQIWLAANGTLSCFYTLIKPCFAYSWSGVGKYAPSYHYFSQYELLDCLCQIIRLFQMHVKINKTISIPSNDLIKFPEDAIDFLRLNFVQLPCQLCCDQIAAKSQVTRFGYCINICTRLQYFGSWNYSIIILSWTWDTIGNVWLSTLQLLHCFHLSIWNLRRSRKNKFQQ